MSSETRVNMEALVLCLNHGIRLHDMTENESAAKRYCRDFCKRDGIPEHFEAAWRQVRLEVFGVGYIGLVP